MTDRVVAEAGWAIWSKLPGASEDYSVLSCSDTFSKTDFAKIISRYTAGTPDTRIQQGPAALPWVTVSWVGVDDALRLGVAITDLTGQVDAVGRPITRTRYFCVPYHQLTRDALSYCGLYEAAGQVTRFPEGGLPVSLAVPRLATADMLATVLDGGKIDDRVVHTAAALLLNGPVSIVQAEGSTVEERLAFLDAVASLLPYGYRAKLTAGTWADSGVRHRLRLAFAARPKDDAVAVSWRHGGEITAGDGVGRRYFDQSRQLATAGDNGRPFPATRIAQIMARYTEPQRFEQPEAALAILRDINLPWRLRQAIRNKEPIDLAELRRVFEGKRLTELDPPRTDLLNGLSLRGEERDWQLFVNSLGEVGEDMTGTGSALAQFGSRLLWNEKPAEAAVRQCLAIAASYGMADSVLAYLVRMPVPTAGHDAGIRILASLVEGAVIRGGENDAGYPFTGRQLAANPVAAAELMAALPPVAAAGLLTLLATALPLPVARTFEFALCSRRGKPVEADIADLSQLGRDCVRALLRAASGTGRLDSVLPAFTGWIAGQGPFGQDDRRYWQQALAGLNPGDIQQRAYLDTALLSVGAAPTALPPPVGHEDYPGYASDLVTIWKRLAGSERFAAENCIRALAAYLDGQPWAADRRQAHAVVELGERLRKHDRGNVLTGALANALDANPAAKGWDFAQQLLEWVRKHDPDAVRNGLLATLEGLPPSSSPARIAELCRRAAAQHVKPDAACSALSRSGAIGTSAAAANLLWFLSWEFDNARIEQKVTADWLRRLAAAIARGDFSAGRADFPREVREHVSRDARRHMWLRFQALATMTKAVRDAQYDLTDDEREELADLAGAIDAFLKKAARRPSLWKNVLPGGRFDDEARQGPRSDVEKDGKGSGEPSTGRR